MKLKKSLGQNFLYDDNILRKEVVVAEVTGKKVLEIGPGDGRLTEKIIEQEPKKLVAVEKDEGLAALLIDSFSREMALKKLDLICTDFLELKPKKFDVILGNIPYYISSAIIFRLKDYEFERAVLIIQKEFAEKMVAKPNDENYGRLSVTSQLAFNIRIVQKVPRHLFRPQPKVDSAMICLTKSKIKITAHDEDIIRLLFQHRNQTVRNALGHSHITAPELFATRRVRTLTKEDCLDIATALRTPLLHK